MTAKGQLVINEMERHLGSWYLYGGAGPYRFDCSGLGYYSYPKAIGLHIGRVTGQQYREGTPVARADVKPGDGIYLEPDASGVPGHVIWVVNTTTAIQAPETGKQVGYCNIDASIAELRLVGIRRFTPWPAPTPPPVVKHNGYVLKQTLKLGTVSPAVWHLRKALGQPVGWTFTRSVEHAVIMFQLHHHLTADGVVGPLTAHALGWGWA